jgi:hypothetical protein
MVVPNHVDKNLSECGRSWPKHVKDNWMWALSITMGAVIKLYVIVTSVTDQNVQS